MRGNHPNPSRTGLQARSIPACAGEPLSRSARAGHSPVYPRVCGGTAFWLPASIPELGLSPRVRGNLGVQTRAQGSRRSIPACAGEPSLSGSGSGSGPVYPRVCGGTCSKRACARGGLGLSPRVRGNLLPVLIKLIGLWSIPACAGEPILFLSARTALRVYPRVCGGTTLLNVDASIAAGLSPRVRGNHHRSRDDHLRGGSIPACAGEPAPASPATATGSVYPRVCGGTVDIAFGPCTLGGLSPRVRGNPDQVRVGPRKAGSIPACAGEPPFVVTLAAAVSVYPRVCGGTCQPLYPGISDQGLSPRVRGNPDLAHRVADALGSIPACAGEPSLAGPSPSSAQVYPRVCGGTYDGVLDVQADAGLSPRVRGNPGARGCLSAPLRSIPACAGEPRAGRRFLSTSQVYPRVCGGTAAAAFRDDAREGLSPRVRGNPNGDAYILDVGRSIPACAGEPRSG